MRLNCPLRPVRGLPEINRIRQYGCGSATKRTNRATARGYDRAKCSPESSAGKCGAFSTASPRVCQRPLSRSSARCACEPGHSVRPVPRSFKPLPACLSVRRAAFRAGPRGRQSSPRVQPAGTRTAPEVEPSGLASIAAVGRGSGHWDRRTIRRRLMHPLAFPSFFTPCQVADPPPKGASRLPWLANCRHARFAAVPISFATGLPESIVAAAQANGPSVASVGQLA